MKLDPEEQIIAAALDQAEPEDAIEQGAGARIEFKREGGAKVTITISREDPVGPPWRVRFSTSTSSAVALTDLRDANGTRP